MIKLLVIWNQNAGKTNIVSRFVHGKYNANYNHTIACDFSIKVFQIDGNEIRIQFWDILGQERQIGSMNKLFCKDAKGALVVADITDELSIESAANWKKAVEEHIAN